jgi:hypothetical protein
MLSSVLTLLAVAALGWALFMFLLKPVLGFSFVRTPLRTLTYFLLLTLFISWVYFPVAGALYASVTLPAIGFLLAITLGINPWLYRFALQEHRVRVATTPAHPDLELLHIDGRFLISKFGDVLFQQTVAGILILILATLGMPLPLLSLIFAVLFLTGHLGLLFRLPYRWSAYFISSAFAAGCFLPYLIMNIPGGFYYAVAFHALWYAVTGAFYWVGEGRRAKAS